MDKENVMKQITNDILYLDEFKLKEVSDFIKYFRFS